MVVTIVTAPLCESTTTTPLPTMATMIATTSLHEIAAIAPLRAIVATTLLPMVTTTAPLQWHLLVVANVNWMLKANDYTGGRVGITMYRDDRRGYRAAYVHNYVWAR